MNVNEIIERLTIPGPRNRGRGNRYKGGSRGRVGNLGFAPSRRPIMGPLTKKAPRTKKSSTSSSTSLSTPKTVWCMNNPLNSSSTMNTTTETDSIVYPDSNFVIAICEGRGLATCEIGIAVIDVVNPIITLCQFSDVFSYVKTLTKLNLFSPTQIIVPATFLLKSNRLIDKIKERFKECSIIPAPRNTFNKQMGLNYVQKICAPTYSPVILTLQQRYYTLSAAGALLNYAEENLQTRLAHQAIKVVYEESEYCTVIDLATADHLELVVSANPVAKSRYACLYGVLNHCKTKIGSRILRASILQPPCDVNEIESRVKCVTELANNNSLLVSIQDALMKLTNIDRLLCFGFVMPTQANMCTERQLNYLLLLNSTLSNVDPLEEILAGANEPFFRQLQQTLQNEKFVFLRDLVREIIHADAHPARGQSGNLQRCFAIKEGINTMLDVMRKIYSEKIEDMTAYVEQLGQLYNMPLKLAHTHKKGFHISMQLTHHQRYSLKISDLPQEFIQVEKMHTCVTMRTFDLVNFSTRIDEILGEVMGMSNIIVYKTLCEVRKEIGVFYKLCDEVAHLDVLQSLAQASLVANYVKPHFSTYMELLDARHPLLDFLCSKEPVPNHIFASEDYNFHVITGPNMSGKSIYLRQIVLLQVMAQLGCYVPATKATFRVADKIFAKVYLEDNMELGASAFVLEMREIQYFFNTMTDNSLIILDELARSTSVEEGTAIAWPICVNFLQTRAFTFLTTHFPNLTRLDEVYFCVKNWQLETVEETDGNGNVKMKFTHTLIPGVTTVKNYGLKICQGFLPQDVLDFAKEIQPLVELKAPSAMNEDIRKEWRGQKLKYDVEAELKLLNSKGELTQEMMHKATHAYKENLLKLGEVQEEDAIKISYVKSMEIKTAAPGEVTDSKAGNYRNTLTTGSSNFEDFEPSIQNNYSNSSINNEQIFNSRQREISGRSNSSIPLFNSTNSSSSVGNPIENILQPAYHQISKEILPENLRPSPALINSLEEAIPDFINNATRPSLSLIDCETNAFPNSFDVHRDSHENENYASQMLNFQSGIAPHSFPQENANNLGFSQFTQKNFDPNQNYENISEISFHIPQTYEENFLRIPILPKSENENGNKLRFSISNRNLVSSCNNFGQNFLLDMQQRNPPDNESLRLIQSYKDSQEEMFKKPMARSGPTSGTESIVWNKQDSSQNLFCNPEQFYFQPVEFNFQKNYSQTNTNNYFGITRQENTINEKRNERWHEKNLQYTSNTKSSQGGNNNFEYQKNKNCAEKNTFSSDITEIPSRTTALTTSTGMTNTSPLNCKTSLELSKNGAVSQETMTSINSKQFFTNLYCNHQTSTPINLNNHIPATNGPTTPLVSSIMNGSNQNSRHSENQNFTHQENTVLETFISHQNSNPTVFLESPAPSTSERKRESVQTISENSSQRSNVQLSIAEIEPVKSMLEEYSEYLSEGPERSFDEESEVFCLFSENIEIKETATNIVEYGTQTKESNSILRNENPCKLSIINTINAKNSFAMDRKDNNGSQELLKKSMEDTERNREELDSSVCKETNISTISSNLNDYYFRSQVSVEETPSFYTVSGDEEELEGEKDTVENKSISYSPEIPSLTEISNKNSYAADENGDVFLSILPDSIHSHVETITEVLEEEKYRISNEFPENDNGESKMHIYDDSSAEENIKGEGNIQTCDDFTAEEENEGENIIRFCTQLEEINKDEKMCDKSIGENSVLQREKTFENVSEINNLQQENVIDIGRSVVLEKSERMVRQSLDDLNKIVAEIRLINQRTLPSNYLEILEKNKQRADVDRYDVVPNTPLQSQNTKESEENVSNRSSSQNCFKNKDCCYTSDISSSCMDFIPGTPVESLMENEDEKNERSNECTYLPPIREDRTSCKNPTPKTFPETEVDTNHTENLIEAALAQVKIDISTPSSNDSACRLSKSFNEDPNFGRNISVEYTAMSHFLSNPVLESSRTLSNTNSSGQEFAEKKLTTPENNDINYRKDNPEASRSGISRRGRKRTLEHPNLTPAKIITRREYEMEKNANFLASLQKYGNNPEKFLAHTHYASFRTFQQIEPLIQFDRCPDGTLKATDVRKKKKSTKKTKFDLVIPEDMRGKSLMHHTLLADANVEKFEECLQQIKKNNKNREKNLHKTLGVPLKCQLISPPACRSTRATSTPISTSVALPLSLMNYSHELERLSLEEAAARTSELISSSGETKLEEIRHTLLESARMVGQGPTTSYKEVETKKKTLGIRPKIGGEMYTCNSNSSSSMATAKGKYGKRTIRKGTKKTSSEENPVQRNTDFKNRQNSEPSVENWGTVAFEHGLTVPVRSFNLETNESVTAKVDMPEVFSGRSGDIKLSFLTTSEDESRYKPKERNLENKNISQLLKKYLD